MADPTFDAHRDCPIPVWLDPSHEVLARHEQETRAEWLERTADDLLALGVPPAGVFGITSHLGVETGDGRLYRAWNMGGVKARQSWAQAVQARTGEPPYWYRAAGNLGSGDPQCVYYRGYPSRSAFLESWLRSYVPRPAQGAPEPPQATSRPNYQRTGWLFWHNDPAWFPELLEQGYRGEVTRANPTPSIYTWSAKAADHRVRWVQGKLKHGATGTWSAEDRAAALAVQRRAGIAQTGEPDDATVIALARSSGLGFGTVLLLAAAGAGAWWVWKHRQVKTSAVKGTRRRRRRAA